MEFCPEYCTGFEKALADPNANPRTIKMGNREIDVIFILKG
jgi:hypothetical protein